MHYLIKKEITKKDTASFRGKNKRCLVPQNFSMAIFQDGDTVSGDEYYVNKAVEIGRSMGLVIEIGDVIKEESKEPKKATVDFYKTELKKREVEFDDSLNKAELKALYDEVSE